MPKYHVNPMGDVHPCTALKQCRFGLSEKEHFDDPAQAREAYEKEMSKIAREPLAGLKKNIFTDKARLARQNTSTVALQLQENFSKEEWEEAFKKDLNTRKVGVTYTNQEIGEPIYGLGYGGDYKAEEEYGISELSQFLSEGKNQADYVAKRTIEGKEVYVFGNPKASFGRYDERSVEYSIEQALKRSAYEDSVGEFQTGKALAIITTDPKENAVLAKMVEAAEGNHLRLGNSSNPFSRGVMFYDERDLTVGSAHALEKQRAWAAQELEKVEPIREKFKAKGQTIYAISKPSLGFNSLVSREGEVDPNETFYWLNSGSVAALGGKQAYGWFTAAELDQMADGDWSIAQREE